MEIAATPTLPAVAHAAVAVVGVVSAGASLILSLAVGSSPITGLLADPRARTAATPRTGVEVLWSPDRDAGARALLGAHGPAGLVRTTGFVPAPADLEFEGVDAAAGRPRRPGTTTPAIAGTRPMIEPEPAGACPRIVDTGFMRTRDGADPRPATAV